MILQILYFLYNPQNFDMTHLTLVIMAAGMATRYGSLKQLDQFGPNGEAIIDYSIFDAIRAGFSKVVFIIRPEIEAEFRSRFDAKLAGKIQVAYVYQEVSSYVPEGTDIAGRIKPWGTGHALMCARDEIDGPFSIINADDFYGRQAFKAIADYLQRRDHEDISLVAYPLRNTLSPNGPVSRGVIIKNEFGHLLVMTEHTKVYERNGEIISQYGDDDSGILDHDTLVSVSLFGFTPKIFDEAEALFRGYLDKFSTAPKAEFYITSVITSVISRNLSKCRVLSTQSPYFGVTYMEDKPSVVRAIKSLIDE